MSKNQAETVIAHGVRVEGDFVSQGDVYIEGEVKGNVQTSGDLRLGTSSKIHADVVAKNVSASGEVRGNIQVAERLELSDSAKVIGDISCEVLSVTAGAQVNGKITMDGRDIKMPEVKEGEAENKS